VGRLCKAAVKECCQESKVAQSEDIADGRGIYGKLGRFGGDCDSVTVGRRNGLQEPATCQPAPGRCMCRRSKSDCDDCFRREDAAIAMQPDFPTVGVGVQQVARRWRSSRRRSVAPRSAWPALLRHSLAAHVLCATSAALSAPQWLFVLLSSFFLSSATTQTQTPSLP
jgi:hypothetical protein